MKVTLFKRILAALCVIVLAVGMLSGCGAKKDSEEKSTATEAPTPEAAAEATDEPEAESQAPAEPADEPSQSEDAGTITLSDGSIYPSEPITILCGWAPGGNSDLMCQFLANAFKERGINANVSYMEGGDGVIALGEIANNTPADGYTMALCSSGQFNVKPFTQDVSYKIDDFDFLPGACEEVYCLYVNKDTGFKDLTELVDYYKNHPDETLRYGMSGSNGIPHLTMRLAWESMGLDNVQIISYDGVATALAGCLGGEVEATCIVAGVGQASYESGDLNAMMVMSGERLATLPDVKTLKEYGYDTLSQGVTKGYVMPAGTDPAILDFLSKQMIEICQTDEWAQFLADNTCNNYAVSGEVYKEDFEAAASAYWDILEEQGLLKEGAEKLPFME